MGKPFVGVHIPAGTGPFPAVLFHKTAEMSPRIFGPFWPFFRPFWAHFGPPSGLGSPQMQWGTLFGPFREPSKAGGNRPRAAKRGSKGHRNVFWDRFRPFGCHFSAFRTETENRFFFDFEAILGHFGPFLAPFLALWILLSLFWGLPVCRSTKKKKKIVF